MKKKISQQQIEGIMQVIYSTNIPAQTFDGIRKLFEGLEEIKEVAKEEKK